MLDFIILRFSKYKSHFKNVMQSISILNPISNNIHVMVTNIINGSSLYYMFIL